MRMWMSAAAFQLTLDIKSRRGWHIDQAFSGGFGAESWRGIESGIGLQYLDVVVWPLLLLACGGAYPASRRGIGVAACCWCSKWTGAIVWQGPGNCSGYGMLQLQRHLSSVVVGALKPKAAAAAVAPSASAVWGSGEGDVWASFSLSHSHRYVMPSIDTYRKACVFGNQHFRTISMSEEAKCAMAIEPT
jgi:hypothetical protein